jgi:ribosome-associated protein
LDERAEGENFPSKSQKKRDANALKALGVKLISLPATTLDKLPLSIQLRQAIDEAKSIKSHGAVRRQSQLIGKLIRTSDPEPIIEAYNHLLAESNAKTAEFHDLECWRDDLIANGKEALTRFIAQYPQTEVQTLRHLIKKTLEEKPGAAKALFRYLRDVCL